MSEILTGDGAKIPQIPQTSVIDAQLRPVVEGIRGIFNVRAFGKNEVDRWVTWRDLVQKNIVVYQDGDTSFKGGSGSNFFPINQDPEDFAVPPVPVNLTAASAALTVILEWDDPRYANLSYAEVWRSTTSLLGDAVRIGTTPSFLYADAVGAGSITYYYWVRFVSKKDVVGPYNSLIGTMSATGLVGNVDLGPLIVEAANLASGAVEESKIKDSAITTTKIAAGSVEEGKIKDSAITTTKIAAGAVEEGKIKDSAITATKIANLAVGNAAIANAAITNAKIGNLAVDSAKIADAAIVNAKIADAAITNAKIGTAEITGAKIAAATIGTANITNGAITNALIGDAAITNAKIGDAQITTAKIGDAQISGAKIQSAAIGTALIADAAIVSAKILDGAILNAKIGDAQITSAKIADAQITNAKIANAQITNAKIGDLEVGTVKIAGNAVSYGGAIVSGGAVGWYTPTGGTLTVVAYSGGAFNTYDQLVVVVDGGAQASFPPGAPVLVYTGGDSGGYQLEAYGPSTGVHSVYLGPGVHDVGFYQSNQAYNAARIVWNFFQR